jgi:hypothetical protein
VPKRSLLEISSTLDTGRSVIDALFRPTTTDWRPYLRKLDLERSLLSNVLESVNREAPDPSHLVVFKIHGAAAVGKTTLLRRIAIELSANDYLVLWMNRVIGESTSQAMKKLTKAAQDVLTADSTLRKRIVIIFDDPWQLRVNVADVLTQLESGKLSTILIVGFRDSDTAGDPADLFIPGSPTSDFLVGHELNEHEIARLPDLLVRIGACKDQRETKALVSRNPYRRASDILCSLWFLLPETRDQLQSSIEDEYRRLGDARAAIEATAATAGKQGELARSAYEAITVTSSLKIGLPIEVLVRALEVDYADWIAATKPGKPVWGLLYDEYEESSDSFTYRTRNEIVTDVLLRLVTAPWVATPGNTDY